MAHSKNLALFVLLSTAMAGCLLSESDEGCSTFSDPKSHACREAALDLLRDAGPRPDIPGLDVGPPIERCADQFVGTRTGLIASGRVSGDDSPLNCGRGDYQEHIVQWVAPFSGAWQVDTNGSGFDTTLGVFVGCFAPSELCDDDGGDGANSLIRFNAQAGQSYLFVVQGFNGRTGAFNLSVTPR